jgi:hypothetical protein
LAVVLKFNIFQKKTKNPQQAIAGDFKAKSG